MVTVLWWLHCYDGYRAMMVTLLWWLQSYDGYSGVCPCLSGRAVWSWRSAYLPSVEPGEESETGGGVTQEILSWSQDTHLTRRDMRAVWASGCRTSWRPPHSHQWYCCSSPPSDPRPWPRRRGPQWIYYQQNTDQRPAGLRSRTRCWRASPVCLVEGRRWLRRRSDLGLAQSTDLRPVLITSTSSSQSTDLWLWLPPPPSTTRNHSAPPAPPSRDKPQVRLAGEQPSRHPALSACLMSDSKLLLIASRELDSQDTGERGSGGGGKERISWFLCVKMKVNHAMFMPITELRNFARIHLKPGPKIFHKIRGEFSSCAMASVIWLSVRWWYQLFSDWDCSHTEHWLSRGVRSSERGER